MFFCCSVKRGALFFGCSNGSGEALTSRGAAVGRRAERRRNVGWEASSRGERTKDVKKLDKNLAEYGKKSYLCTPIP